MVVLLVVIPFMLLWLTGWWIGRAAMTLLLGIFGLVVLSMDSTAAHLLGAGFMLAAYPIGSAPVWVYRLLQAERVTQGRFGA